MEQTTSRPCERCKGEGKNHHKGFTLEGKVYPDRTVECRPCGGTGTFEPLDVQALVGLCLTKKGWRKSWPKSHGNRFSDRLVGRAYYVWRLARFHGGADVTIPITASTVIHSDPFLKELDFVAEECAKRVFGTDMAAAYRWGNLLVAEIPVPTGLPDSAYAGGPVKSDGEE